MRNCSDTSTPKYKDEVAHLAISGLEFFYDDLGSS